ncbi:MULTISPECIES: hypothetical protein [unclassified Bradyrhizobium]|uniref:hypothetical protein n=1 Tax=unclassified Bradyrhizobium TaxID=2631580 RepID=UPI0028E316C6|nr:MULTISPECIES: hypothetical protein [unclassified Bradyrhizobium]
MVGSIGFRSVSLPSSASRSSLTEGQPLLLEMEADGLLETVNLLRPYVELL